MKKYLLLLMIPAMSNLAWAWNLPQCANKYRGTKHDAEWSALFRAFEAASTAVPGVPVSLALAVGIAESNLNQEAVSVTDAVGIMQVSNEAEEHIHVIQRRIGGPLRSGDKYNASRYNLSSNILLGFKYLDLAMYEAGGSIEGALVFYNSGYYGLTRWKNKRSVPNETAQYVLRVLKLYGECSK